MMIIDLGETEVWVGSENEFRNAINNLVLVQCLACSFEKLCVPGRCCECTRRAKIMTSCDDCWHEMSVLARGRETAALRHSAQQGKSVSDVTGRPSMWCWRKAFLAYSSRLHSALLIRKWNGAALINEQGSLQLQYRVKTLSFWKYWVKV